MSQITTLIDKPKPTHTIPATTDQTPSEDRIIPIMTSPIIAPMIYPAPESGITNPIKKFLPNSKRNTYKNRLLTLIGAAKFRCEAAVIFVVVFWRACNAGLLTISIDSPIGARSPSKNPSIIGGISLATKFPFSTYPDLIRYKNLFVNSKRTHLTPKESYSSPDPQTLPKGAVGSGFASTNQEHPKAKQGSRAGCPRASKKPLWLCMSCPAAIDPPEALKFKKNAPHMQICVYTTNLPYWWWKS